MRKSIYLIELSIYSTLGVLLGLTMTIGGRSWDYFAGGIGICLAWYFAYLISVQILRIFYDPGFRIIGVIASAVFGAWMVYVPGEIARRMALSIYEGDRPVETLFGRVSRCGRSPGSR